METLVLITSGFIALVIAVVLLFIIGRLVIHLFDFDKETDFLLTGLLTVLIIIVITLVSYAIGIFIASINL